jgi:hypothetical protein
MDSRRRRQHAWLGRAFGTRAAAPPPAGVGWTQVGAIPEAVRPLELTMSNSAVFFAPATRFCVRVGSFASIAQVTSGGSAGQRESVLYIRYVVNA